MIFSEFSSFFLALFAPFLVAIVAPVLVRVLKYNAAWLLALVPAWMFYHFVGYVAITAQGQTSVIALDWIPSFGVEFSFYIDGLSILFSGLISGIGTLIVLYSGGYLKGHPDQGRFFSFIFLFMGSMVGLVLANNLITLFIFWELTSITSFLLIGFNHTAERSRRAAFQALVVTGGGGLILLAGLLMLSLISGETNLSTILQKGDFIKESGWLVPIFILILGGAFTKSAQFPFHFWLANAMEAPTPVSAYLHSATMVKAGVYLLMRVQPIFGDTLIWTTILPLFGSITLLFGTILAIRQTDMKLMLAYTTIASLGLLVMLIGTSIEKAIEGAVLYLFAHSLFKGALFMVVGSVDHEAGSREISELSGLASAMPLTFLFACLASLSMAGFPPFIGFIAKEILYEGIWGANLSLLVLSMVAVLGNILMLVIAFAVALKPFVGAKQDSLTLKQVHEAPILLWLGPGILSICGLLAALFTNFTGKLIVQPTASSIIGTTWPVNLYLFPTYISMPLILSIFTITMGIVTYLFLDVLRKYVDSLLNVINWGPDEGFDQVIRSILRFASVLTNLIQFGAMKGYLTITFMVLVAILYIPLIIFNEWPSLPALPYFAFHEWAIFAVAIIGIVTVLTAKSGLIAIVSLGIQGFAVAIIFMLFGAPDLSFTQFMVETLSVVILALVMTRLNLTPRESRSKKQVLFDGSLATAAGVAVGLILIAATQVPFNSELPDFFEKYSRVLAHGRNVVNVILVDYRGVDTLGEIAVVMIAGLAVIALIRIATPKKSADKININQLTDDTK